MSINITENVCDDGTISCRHSLGHQTLETHPQKDGHDDDDDDDDGKDDGDSDEDSDDDDDDDDGSKGADGSGDGNQNCCDNLATGCVILDNDPRVHYVGPWVLKATESSTSHNTVVEGSTVSLIFNGSAIVVFGTVPASYQSEPPTVAYYLDTLPPTTTILPQATDDIPNQPLYSSLDLSPNEEHRLFINVTKTQPEAPYVLTSFSISPVSCSNSSQPSQATSPPATVSASSATIPDHKTTILVAGVLGSLVFLFVVAILVFLILRYVRRERVYSENPPETVYSAFTTTESILRNDSNIWSQAPSPFSFNETSSQIPRPSRFLWSTGSDFSWPSDFAQPREATGRLSVMKFALPPHSKSLSTSPSILENN